MGNEVSYKKNRFKMNLEPVHEPAYAVWNPQIFIPASIYIVITPN